jgi:hypothetical protein
MTEVPLSFFDMTLSGCKSLAKTTFLDQQDNPALPSSLFTTIPHS